MVSLVPYLSDCRITCVCRGHRVVWLSPRVISTRHCRAAGTDLIMVVTEGLHAVILARDLIGTAL